MEEKKAEKIFTIQFKQFNIQDYFLNAQLDRNFEWDHKLFT